METRKPIVVIGSINMDLVCRVARRPAPGETIIGQHFATMHGGKGANQAVAAARLGGDVHLIARVGDDPFGQKLLLALQHNGVHTDHVLTTADTASGVAMIVVDDSGENSIIVTPGANAKLTPADIDAAIDIIANAVCVVLQLETPYETIEHAIDTCRRLGVYTILDPAPAPTHFMPPTFFHVDLITPNQHEAQMILGLHSDASKNEWVGEQLLRRGARAVVLKLGGEGTMRLDCDGTIERIKAFPITAVDTTAAGDAFTAGLAVGFAEKMDSACTVRFANAAGALACTKFGAQSSLPTRSEVDTLQYEHPRSST